MLWSSHAVGQRPGEFSFSSFSVYLIFSVHLFTGRSLEVGTKKTGEPNLLQGNLLLKYTILVKQAAPAHIFIRQICLKGGHVFS